MKTMMSKMGGTGDRPSPGCYKTVIYAYAIVYKVTDDVKKVEKYLEECRERLPGCSMSVATVPSY